MFHQPDFKQMATPVQVDYSAIAGASNAQAMAAGQAAGQSSTNKTTPQGSPTPPDIAPKNAVGM